MRKGILIIAAFDMSNVLHIEFFKQKVITKCSQTMESVNVF